MKMVGLLISTAALCMIISTTHATLSLTVPKTIYNPGEYIPVTMNAVGVSYTSGSAWCGLIPNTITSNEETVNDGADVSFIRLQDEGTSNLVTSIVGVYSIKCFGHDAGGEYLGELGSEIMIQYIYLSVPKTVYNPGENIPVTMDASGASYTAGSAWCGLIPNTVTSNEETVNDGADVNYFKLQNEGTLNLKTSTVGTYIIKCFGHDSGGEYLGRLESEITVSVATLSLSVPKYIYTPGESIPVTMNAVGVSYTSGSAWCGLIPNTVTSNEERVNDAADVSWIRLQDEGTSNLVTSIAGTYVVKCFAHDAGGEYLGELGSEITVSSVSAGLSLTVPDTIYYTGDIVPVTMSAVGVSYTAGSAWCGLIPNTITSDEERVNHEQINQYEASESNYLGCYKDGTGIYGTSGTRTFEYPSDGIISVNNVADCVGICVAEGYKFMGLQFGRECFCSNGNEYIMEETRNPDILYISGSDRIYPCGVHEYGTDKYNAWGCSGGPYTNCVYDLTAVDVDYFVLQDQGTKNLETSTPGTYIIKCFANNNGGAYLGRLESEITIERARLSISVRKDIYNVNQIIPVTVNAVGVSYKSGSAWCGLIPYTVTSTTESENAAASVSSFVLQDEGTLNLVAPDYYGVFVIKCFANDYGGQYLRGFGWIFVRPSVYPLTVPKTIYNIGENIPVTYDTGGVGFTQGSAWCGLIPNTITSHLETVNDGADVSHFVFLNWEEKGTKNLVTSTSGIYVIKCFSDDNGGNYIGRVEGEITIQEISAGSATTIFTVKEALLTSIFTVLNVIVMMGCIIICYNYRLRKNNPSKAKYLEVNVDVDNDFVDNNL